METDYTKWSFKNKLWAALAACGSLAVLAYPPWFFRAQSFRAWIFESQVSGRLDAGRIAHRLRHFATPVFARVHDGRVLADPRTLLEGDEEILVAAFRAALGEKRD